MKEIPLTKGLVALVDDDDFERVSALNWQAFLTVSKTGIQKWYAARRIRTADGRRSNQLLHRFILNDPSADVDHANGNGLDNQKANLRPCTPRQNNRNQKARTGTSRFKGVHWHQTGKKWRAMIRVDGGRIDLGLFDHEEDAARAYDDAARQHHGEFGRLNFPAD